MKNLPPKKPLSDVFTANITFSQVPTIFLRPIEWEEDFLQLEMALHNVKDFRHLETSSKKTLCLVMLRDADNIARGLERGCIKSSKCDGKFTVLLIDTGCQMEVSMEDLYQIPSREDGEERGIMDYPTLCAKFFLANGDSISANGMKSLYNTFLMELGFVGCEMVDAGSPDPVPVVKLTAGVGEIADKITSLFTAFSLTLQQPVPPIPVPTPGQFWSERAVVTRFKSTEDFTVTDLATQAEIQCFAGKTSVGAKKRFKRKFKTDVFESQIFRVFCKTVLVGGRCHVELHHIPQGQP